MSDTLNHQQALRYNRQVLLPGFDLEGQEKLLCANVLIMGMGGLGNPAAQYLAASGVGHLTLCDDDKVELSNLHRQILFAEGDIGQQKVQAASTRLHAINSECRITSLATRPDEKQLSELISQHQVILDCTDNLASRNLINRLCVQLQKPLVSGAAIRMEGQLFCYRPHLDCPCYQCLSSLFGEQNLSCVESGILSPVVGVIGVMQALMAVKLLAGLAVQTAQLQQFDARTGQWHTFKLSRHPDCPVCVRSSQRF